MYRRVLLPSVLFILGTIVAVHAQYAEPTWIRSGTAGAVVDLAYSPNARWLASIALDGTLKVWDLQSNRLYHHFPNALATSAVFFSDNQRVATGTADGSVRIWNIHTGELVQSITAHNGRAGGVDLSPNGQYLASAGSDGLVKLWNTSNWSAVRTITGHVAEVNTVDFSPDNASLVTASEDRSVRTWSVSTGAQIRIWNDTALHLRKSASYSADGNYVAATSGECFYTSTGCGITIFNASSGAVVKQFTQIRLDAADVVYSSDGLRIASADDYGTIYVYRADSLNLNPVARVRHRAGTQQTNFLGANAVQFAPDGSVLASAGDDRMIRFWRASDNATGVIIDSASNISSTDVNQAGDRVAIGREDGVVLIRETANGDMLRSLTRIDSVRSSLDSRWTYLAGPSVQAVSWRPDGSRLAVGTDADTIRIWNPGDGTVARAIDGAAATTSLLWTPTGDRLLSGHGAPVNGVKVWNATSWSVERTLDAAGATVTSLALAGGYIVVGSEDGFIRIWNASDWSPVRAVSAHLGPTVDVACSDDGAYVASASADTFRIWRLAEGTSVSYGIIGYGSIRSIAFSSDNAHLIVTTTTGAVVVHRVVSGFASYVNDEYQGDAVSVDVSGGDVYVGTADGSTIRWPFKAGDPGGELPSPVLVAPANATGNLSSPLAIYWTSVPSVTGYDVQVSTEGSFTSGLIVDQTNLADTFKVLATLNTGTTYHWRVRARGAIGQSAWSGAWTFTTQGGIQLGVPMLSEPADKATDVPLTVTLRWEPAIGAEWYRVQIADNDAFSAPLVDEMQVTETSYTAQGLAVGRTYHWRVRSRRNGSPSTSPWSATRSFTTTSSTSADGKTVRPAGLRLSVLPNPVDGVASITVSAPRAAYVRVSLITMTGEVMMDLPQSRIEEGRQSIIFDVSGLPVGLYIVRIDGDGETATMPMVVER